jgi:TPR repeat protein
MTHLHSAAKQNHTPSMFQIGVMYDNAIGVTQDAMKAVDWYRKSKQSEKPPDRTLAFYKEKNNKLERVDYEEIFKDLLIEAENGNAEIQFQVATIYDQGKLVPLDFNKALGWYKRSAQNNYEEAQFMMGYFYCRGIGVPKDNKIANDWLVKSKRIARCSD